MNKKYLVAAFLGGISLAMASALLASSAWLLSMASLRPPILTLQVAVVSVRFFGLGRGVFRYLERLASHDAAFMKLTKARKEIFNSFVGMPFSLLKEFSRGEVLQRLTHGIERREDLYLRVIVPWLSAILAGVSGISILIFLVPTLGLFAGILFLIVSALLPGIGYLSSEFEEKKQVVEESLSKEVVLAIEARDEALVFNYAPELRSEVAQHAESLKRIDKRDSVFTGMGNSLVTFGAGLTVLVAIYLTYREVNAGLLTAVNFAVAILLPLAIFDALSTLPSAFSTLGEILKARKQIAVLISASENVSKGPTQKGVMRNSQVQNIQSTDYYSQLVLEDFQGIRDLPQAKIGKITTIIARGSVVLLTGQSGTGKSSAALALLGLLEYEGSAQLDGTDVNKLDVERRTDLITLAPQDDYLFSSSIRENLKIGNPAASDNQLWKVLEIVELDALVQSLPDNLDSHVGSRGINFSGGEQRRLLLARALLRSRPFVILDEPFEFLDQGQISRIAPRVFDYLKGSGVLVISHLPISGVDKSISIDV